MPILSPFTLLVHVMMVVVVMVVVYDHHHLSLRRIRHCEAEKER